MIAPGSLNNVTNNIVQIFKGILTLIKDPNKLIPKINSKAIKIDLNNHFKNFFISTTHIIIWDNVYVYY